jgi:hypothetical protein
MITCTSCQQTKELSCFQIRPDTGQPRKQCKTCRSAQREQRYQLNKETENANAMIRYLANHEEEKTKRKEYYRKNKDAHKARMDKWRKENPERNKEINRLVGAKQRKKPYYRYREMLRSLVRRLGSNDRELLGYTLEEFKENIESKFKTGMTWDNHGEWEIDHIKPVAQFYKENELDPKVVNALSNLQPLWRSENRKKSSKYVDN